MPEPHPFFDQGVEQPPSAVSGHELIFGVSSDLGERSAGAWHEDVLSDAQREVLGAVRQDYVGAMIAGESDNVASSRFVKFLVGGAIFALLLATVPLFFLPTTLAHSTSSTTTTPATSTTSPPEVVSTQIVQARLASFARYKMGTLAVNGDVQWVLDHAHASVTKSGASVWAVLSGATCWGVGFGSGFSGTVENIESLYCAG